MNAWSPRGHGVRALSLAVLLLSVASCGGGGGSSLGGGGGGGGGSGGGSGSGSGGSGWVAGVFQPSSNFINRCQAPRSGTDPFTGRPYPDTRGATLDENNFLRSWTNETYLWYSEVPDLDPGLYQTADYFTRLKTSGLSPTGAPKDKFHSPTTPLCGTRCRRRARKCRTDSRGR